MLFFAILAIGDAYGETFSTARTRAVWVSPTVPLVNNPSVVSYTNLQSAWDGRPRPGRSWLRAEDSSHEGLGSRSAAISLGIAAALASLRLQSGRRLAMSFTAGNELAHMRLTSTGRQRSSARMAAGEEGKAAEEAPERR